MPDSASGPHIVTTRRDLANLIRYKLDFYEMPASLIRDVRITHLWQFIAHNGASVAHFSLDHKGSSLAFHGLTEEESNEMEENGAD